MRRYTETYMLISMHRILPERHSLIDPSLALIDNFVPFLIPFPTTGRIHPPGRVWYLLQHPVQHLCP